MTLNISGRCARVAISGAVLFGLIASGMVPTALARHAVQSTAGAPKSGGTIAYRDVDTPTCVDPLVAPTTAEGLADFPTFDNLVLLDGQGIARPDLATSWSYSHGGRWITFKLRRGVKFSNGHPFNAGVVKFNMNRVLGPVGQAAGMSSFLGPLRKVQIDNPYQATFIFTAPFRPALPNLANDSLGIVDPIAYRAEGKTRYCRYPIGTGPYQIQNYAPGGTQITLVRNKYHTWETPWAHNRGPTYIDKIVLKPILSDSTAVSELLSGGVDISQVAGTQLSRVTGNPNITRYRVHQQFVTSLGFNTSHAPFNSVAVRRAIAEAVDRNAVIKAAFAGLAVPSYSFIDTNVPFYDPGTKKLAPRYNPADAQRILSANHVAGTFTLLSNNRPTTTAADELIQAELQNVGLKVNIVAKPTPDYISLAQKGNYDISVDSFYSPDASVLYSTYNSTQETSGGLNFTFYKSAYLDRLTTQGQTTFNQKKANAAYSAAQRFILKNVISDPLLIPVTIFGVRNKVQGFHTDITGLWPLFQDLWIK